MEAKIITKEQIDDRIYVKINLKDGDWQAIYTFFVLIKDPENEADLDTRINDRVNSEIEIYKIRKANEEQNHVEL